ncbi:MAG: MATE family efflux transporter [Burkholderiaceae bacterium]|jgi:MATE family multidrug resistance protein|nr:MATE family efflux transporter [Burkholderiaceae bacterium]
MSNPLPEPRQGHRRVLRLAVPIVLSNLSVPLVGLVDTAVMGRMPGPQGIGAVALGAVIFSFVYWGFGFLRMGTTGLVAREQGTRDREAMAMAIGRSLVLALVLGLMVILLQWPIARLAVMLAPASSEVEAGMLEYFRIRVWSAPAVLLQYVLLGVFIGMQRTGYALVTQVLLNVCNAALSILFVIVFGWGVTGIAVSSLIAEYFGLAVGLFLLARLLARRDIRLSLAPLRGLAAYRTLVAVNGNIFLRTLCLIAAFAWFHGQGASFGDMPLAANAILLQMVNLLAYGLDGFAHAAEALVGEAIGAGDRQGYRWALGATSIWAGGTALVYALLYFAFGPWFIAMMTDLVELRETAAIYLPWVVAMPLLAVWSYQLDGIFIGSLRTREMRDGMVIAFVAFLAAVFLLTPAWGNHGLWAALAVFFVARALTLLVCMRRRAPEFEGTASA